MNKIVQQIGSISRNSLVTPFCSPTIFENISFIERQLRTSRHQLHRGKPVILTKEE